MCDGGSCVAKKVVSLTRRWEEIDFVKFVAVVAEMYVLRERFAKSLTVALARDSISKSRRTI